MLLSKGFKEWVVYLGKGASELLGETTFSSRLLHDFMALEYRIDGEQSVVLQTVAQSSVFSRSAAAAPRGTFQDGASFSITSPTNVVVIGYKGWFSDFFLEIGFVEDYTQAGNETDVVLYTELGLRW